MSSLLRERPIGPVVLLSDFFFLFDSDAVSDWRFARDAPVDKR